MSRRVYYFDRVKQKMVEGYPPQPQKFGQAPYVIGDTIDAYYHPKAGMWVESKRALESIDRATGCITTDRMLEPIAECTQRREKELEEDRIRSIYRAAEAIDSGQRQFSEGEREFHNKVNQGLSDKYNFNAFDIDILGKKKNDKRRKRKPAA